jgi:hypothetical protein
MFLAASTSAQATEPTAVTTSALNTGPNSELVSSVPIYKNWEPSVEKVVYSLPIPSVRAGETLRATGNVELTGGHSYQVSASERLVLGSSPSNAEGVVVTPRANTTFTPQMSRLTLPIDGVYNASADLGTQYLKLVVKAPAWEAKEGDTLSVVSGSGELAVTRYVPTAGPTSLPTHELQSCKTASEQISSIPVDYNWHSVLSCDMGEISTEDLLEVSGQLEVGNTNSSKVRLDSRVLAATTPTGTEAGTNGWVISQDTSDTLTPSNRFARVVQANEASANSPSKHYVNLLVRAVPLEGGFPTPLTVESESAVLNVLRFKPNPGSSANSLWPGTFERFGWDDAIDKSTVPFAAEGKSPVVVNSASIDELRKGEVIRAHGILAADLNGGEAAPVETEIVLAAAKTATTGETVARRSGDTIPTAQQVHTITKSATFVAPKDEAERKYLNLVAYANRAPSKSGEEMKVSKASVSYSRSKPVGSSTQPFPVTTSALDTGPSSELISSVPITSSGEAKVLYSLPISSIKAGETLRATGNFELTGSHSYQVSASARLLLGSNPTDTNGALVTPRANTTFTPQMSRLTMPIDGVYRAISDLGTQYLKLIVKAPAYEAKAGDTLGVVSNSGRLAVTRYAPTAGPTSVPTHELGSCSSTSEQITVIAVDSSWHSVLSCDMGEISTEDLLELSGQLEVGNTNSSNVRLESRVLSATTSTGTEPGPNGYILSEDTSDTLTSSNRFARIVQSNENSANSSSKHYVNLLVRAVPLGGGSFTPLTIEAGSAMLNVLRFKPNPGNPAEVMRPGTMEVSNRNSLIEQGAVPFAAESKSPIVVNSIPIHGLAKGDVIRAHGVLTADLDGGEAAPVETELIMADNATATTGETVARRSGDTIPTAQQVHTITKSATFVAPKASFADKYLNFVVYANRAAAKEKEALKISKAMVSYSRSEPRTLFSADFENGSLDQFFRYGQISNTNVTSNQAREGTRSMQVDVDSTSISEGDPEGVRRAEIVPPDRATSGGFSGVDRWYGWSVYFPESFKAPQVEPSYFTGKIDEVRLYGQSLTESQIKTDEKGEYEKTGATPIAAYAFSESKEEVEKNEIAHDSTAGHHDGMIEGATWTGSGKYGSALEFNGFDNLVRVPDANDLDLTKSFTLEAWVDPEAESVRWWDPVIAKTEGEEGHASGYLLNAGFHHFPAGFAYNAGSEAVAGGLPEKNGEITELPTHTWSHLALTSDGKNLKIYVNGVLKVTKPAIEAAPTSGDLTVGTNEFNPGLTGNWDIFTQWHHSIDGGLGCDMDTSIPIAFSATGYRAGFRYSEAEPPVPASGDYIDLMLNGGQLEEVEKGMCHSITPTQRYILAPLHRGQWYDFVLHTRWTTEEGGPGNSITSVWINGKQVIGDQTIPVSKPTEYWKGSPAIHNSIMTWQFGLYRGPTVEDPTTRLFVDSARTGESYAEVAPETHAPRIEAETDDATLSGSGFNTFTTSKGAFSCEESVLAGQTSEVSRGVALGAAYSGCTATSSKFFSTVAMNSCHYDLSVKNEGPPYVGTLGIACERGDAIEYKEYSESGGSLLCAVKVRPQTGLKEIELLNIGEGVKRGVGLIGEAKSVQYEYAGGASCPSSETRSDGVLSVGGSLFGLDEFEEQIGIHLSGDGFLPRVEAESYGATLKGAGLETFTSKAATTTCSETALQATIGEATSHLSLAPQYAGCKTTGLTTTASMSSCSYTLSLNEAAPPYTGTWGIACGKEGAIRFDVYLKSKVICTAKIGPQEGLSGVGLVTSGAGTARGMALEAEVKGIKYELSGSNCGTTPGTYTDGVLKGKTTLAATDEGGAPIGAWLAGEP